ncbi:MAG TPA: hypothetical protein VHY08_19960 [Bacillota bacterium]|nr:hypothetical protein [Bacillota bacterium]
MPKINDRFLRGLTGGLIAGTCKDLPDIFLVDLFKIKHLAFWDYVGEMILNQIPKSLSDHILAFIIEVAFSLGLGIIYSIIVIPAFPSKHYLVRGMIYGSACWFILMSLIKLFHISSLFVFDKFTPLATLFLSAVYGLMLAFLDKYFAPPKGA